MSIPFKEIQPLNPKIGFNINSIQRQIQPLNLIQRQFHSETVSSIKPTNRIQHQFHSKTDSTIKPTLVSINVNSSQRKIQTFNH